MKNQLMWFFRICNGGDVSYMAAKYDTNNHAEVCRWLSDEYGVKVVGSIRRELTFPEYRGLLLCQRYSDVWDAMLAVFFRLP